MSIELVNVPPSLTESAELRLVDEISEARKTSPIEKQFVNFVFFRVNPDWRKLAPEIKRAAKGEFQSVYDAYRDRFLLFSYSLVGFDSKADLATYIVRQPHLDWRTVYVDSAIDPVVQLRGLIDLAIRELPDFLLALDLAEELEVPGMAHFRRGLFAEGNTVIGRYIAAVRPGMTPEAARDLAGLVLALLVGSHETGDAVPATVATTRERIVRVLRAELVPIAVESARFDRAMAGT